MVSDNSYLRPLNCGLLLWWHLLYAKVSLGWLKKM